MSWAKWSLLCHGLNYNGNVSTICPIFKESENSDTFQFWHFPILTLSSSDTFQFSHFPILTLSNSYTFRFWYFPISSKMGKNWIPTLSNSDTSQSPNRMMRQCEVIVERLYTKESMQYEEYYRSPYCRLCPRGQHPWVHIPRIFWLWIWWSYPTADWGLR